MEKMTAVEKLHGKTFSPRSFFTVKERAKTKSVRKKTYRATDGETDTRIQYVAHALGSRRLLTWGMVSMASIYTMCVRACARKANNL